MNLKKKLPTTILVDRTMAEALDREMAEALDREYWECSSCTAIHGDGFGHPFASIKCAVCESPRDFDRMLSPGGKSAIKRRVPELLEARDLEPVLPLHFTAKPPRAAAAAPSAPFLTQLERRRQQSEEVVRAICFASNESPVTLDHLRGLLGDDGEGVVNTSLFTQDAEYGRTPLAYAVVKNDEESVRNLVALGANVNATMGGAAWFDEASNPRTYGCPARFASPPPPELLRQICTTRNDEPIDDIFDYATACAIRDGELVLAPACHDAVLFVLDQSRLFLGDVFLAAQRGGGATAFPHRPESPDVAALLPLIFARLVVCLKEGETALTMAVQDLKYDQTELATTLLSLGANPKCCDRLWDHDNVRDNASLQWFIRVAKNLPPSTPQLVKMHEQYRLHSLAQIPFGIVGQGVAAVMVRNAVRTHMTNLKQKQGKPLVMLFAGAPGHGKTMLSNMVAKAVVDDVRTRFLFIPMSTVNEISDLFGGTGVFHDYGSGERDGQLTSFVRRNQGRRCVVLLDEYEKWSGKADAGGHARGKELYQKFLQVFEGKLTDYGRGGGEGRGGADNTRGNTLDLSKVIFICTTNLGQEKLVSFSDSNAWVTRDADGERAMSRKIQQVKAKLVRKVYRPLLEAFFRKIDPSVVAIARRFDLIVPFLPFTRRECVVVADHTLRRFFAEYRYESIDPDEAAGIDGRMIGDLCVRFDSKLTRYAAEQYDSMRGSDAMREPAIDAVQQVTSMYVEMGDLEALPKVPVPHPRGLHQCWVEMVDDDELPDDIDMQQMHIRERPIARELKLTRDDEGGRGGGGRAKRPTKWDEEEAGSASGGGGGGASATKVPPPRQSLADFG